MENIETTVVNNTSLNIWDYFNKCISSDNYKRAQCTFCKNVYSYATTITNLKTHLAQKHGINVDKCPIRSKLTRPRKTLANNSARYWKHYTKDEDEYKVAICNYCSKKYSYKSTVFNLNTHLSKKHPDVYEKYFQKLPDLDAAEEVYLDGNDSESSDDAVSRCEEPSCDVTATRAELRAHMRDQHPGSTYHEDSEFLLKEDNEDDIYTEVVYLDNPDSPRSDRDRKPRPQPARRRRPRFHSDSDDDRQGRKRRGSASSGEVRHRPHDEEQSFGSYIACLLRKMRRSASRRVQMNIVNMILQAGLEDDARTSVSEMVAPPSARKTRKDSAVLRRKTLTDSVKDEEKLDTSD